MTTAMTSAGWLRFGHLPLNGTTDKTDKSYREFPLRKSCAECHASRRIFFRTNRRTQVARGAP
jgi:hypothetical protein